MQCANVIHLRLAMHLSRLHTHTRGEHKKKCSQLHQVGERSSLVPLVEYYTPPQLIQTEAVPVGAEVCLLQGSLHRIRTRAAQLEKRVTTPLLNVSVENGLLLQSSRLGAGWQS